MQRIEVDDVEAPQDRAVEEERPHPVERPGRPEDLEDPLGRVPAVDPDPVRADRLHVIGRRDHKRRDRRRRVVPVERAVVDRGDPRVRLRERSP